MISTELCILNPPSFVIMYNAFDRRYLFYYHHYHHHHHDHDHDRDHQHDDSHHHHDNVDNFLVQYSLLLSTEINFSPSVGHYRIIHSLTHLSIYLFLSLFSSLLFYSILSLSTSLSHTHIHTHIYSLPNSRLFCLMLQRTGKPWVLLHASRMVGTQQRSWI